MALTIRHHVYSDGECLRAYVGRRNIARIEWESGGEIIGVWVQPEYRRQGIASSLYQEAQIHTRGFLAHSADRTPDGDAWARAVGGDLPTLSCLPYGAVERERRPSQECLTCENKEVQKKSLIWVDRG